MALSTAVATVNAYPAGTDVMEQHRFVVYGTIAIQASPGTYTAGGLALDLTSFPVLNLSNTTPQWVEVQSAGTGAAVQYEYVYNLSTGNLQVFTGGTEISTAATPAGVSEDVIVFRAEYLKG